MYLQIRTKMARIHNTGLRGEGADFNSVIGHCFGFMKSCVLRIGISDPDPDQSTAGMYRIVVLDVLF
jgi:hypothetical protein